MHYNIYIVPDACSIAYFRTTCVAVLDYILYTPDRRIENIFIKYIDDKYFSCNQSAIFN